jgi:predicted lysophospholipase L1 biosynthesis ABC-type transport system permease subunit
MPWVSPFWRTALRIVWRYQRSSPRRAFAAMFVIALGSASVTAIGSLSVEMHSKLRGNAREWIASDVSVRLPEPPSDDEIEAVTRLLLPGTEDTLVIETYGLAISSQVPDALLAYVKVVDPARYPFYGKVDVRPSLPLSQALTGDSIAVSPDLAERLKLPLGGTVHLGAAEFHVAAIIMREPDWYSGIASAVPRILLSPANFERSGIARGGVSLYRWLFRLAPAGLPALRESLEQIFPYAEVVDYRDPDPRAAASFDQASDFIALAGVMALLTGALAMGLIMRLNAQQHLDTVAVLKALGARSSQVVTIYAVEAAGLGLAGGILGAAAGPLLERALAALAQIRFPLGLAAHWGWQRSVEALALGLVASLPGSLGPVLRLREVSPLAALRRHMGFHRPDAARKISLRRFPLFFRLGARNLFRPGQHSAAIVFALAAGVTMLSATYIGQRQISQTIAQSLPAQGSNLYLLGASQSQLERARTWLAQQPDVEGAPQAFPMLWLRLSRVNEVAFDARATALGKMWLATCADDIPEGAVALPGARQALQPNPGDLLEFVGKGKTLRGRVAAQPRDFLDQVIPVATFPCSQFEDLAVFYQAAVRVHPGREIAVRRALAAHFPDLPTLSRTEFTNLVRGIADQATAMAQLVSWGVLGIGIAMQILLVTAAKRLRLEEIAIAKALGARPGFLARVISVEYGLLGLGAGLIGSLSGAVLASLILTAIQHRTTIVFDMRTVVVATVFTAALAAAVGWLTTAGLSRFKPLEILRDE